MKKKILVVDDDVILLKLMERSAQIFGEDLHLITVADAKTGLQTFLETDIDLVISDNNMPGMSGLEMIKAIRAIDPILPIMIFSGGLNNYQYREIQGLHIQRMLEKPLPPSQLFQEIRDVLGRQ